MCVYIQMFDLQRGRVIECVGARGWPRAHVCAFVCGCIGVWVSGCVCLHSE